MELRRPERDGFHPGPLIDQFLGRLRGVVAEAAPVAIDDRQHHGMPTPRPAGGERRAPPSAKPFRAFPERLQAVDHDVGPGQCRRQPLAGGDIGRSTPRRQPGSGTGRSGSVQEAATSYPPATARSGPLRCPPAGSAGNTNSSHALRLPARRGSGLVGPLPDPDSPGHNKAPGGRCWLPGAGE